MRIRWVAAALGAVTLAVLTMTLPVRWERQGETSGCRWMPEGCQAGELRLHDERYEWERRATE